MMRYAFAMLAMMAAWASPVSAHEPMPPGTVFKPMEFEGAPVTERRFETLLDIVDKLIDLSEGSVAIRIANARYLEAGDRVILVTESGYQDDSVQGSQWRFLVKWQPSEDEAASSGWAVVEAGQRWRCYRGETPYVWQPRWCP